MNIRYVKIGPNLVPMQCPDKERVPDWLTAASCIAFVVVIGIAFITALWVTP